MAPFYKELKDLRTQQNIDLTEVANRTKISIKFLEALESGDFSFLPQVYVRLFCRAYALEIGADPEGVLSQLEAHISREETPPPEQLTIEDTMAQEEQEEYKKPEKSPFEARSDLIKVAVLIVIFLFAIFIIKKITSPERAVGETQWPAAVEESGSQAQNVPEETSSPADSPDRISTPDEKPGLGDKTSVVEPPQQDLGSGSP